MIHYRLVCDADHEFESWFRDSAGFDAQAAQDLETVDLGHAQIDEHGVVAARDRSLDGLRGVFDFIGPVIERARQLRQDETRNHVIVHHQHCQRDKGQITVSHGASIAGNRRLRAPDCRLAPCR